MGVSGPRNGVPRKFFSAFYRWSVHLYFAQLDGESDAARLRSPF